MYLTATHIIKKGHRYFKEADRVTWLSKNLYNRGNYIVRQTFVETSKLKAEGKVEHATYLNYYELKKIIKEEDCYKALPRKVSNLTLIQLDKNWRSFFAAIKEWKKCPDKFTGRPSLPNYLHREKGRFLARYEKGAISTPRHGKVRLSGTDILLPYKEGTKEVRIVPITGGYKAEVVYGVAEPEMKQQDGRFIGVDIGVNNLAAMTSNVAGIAPVLINGRPIKSINQWYNKRKAKMQSCLPKGAVTSTAIQRISLKRDQAIANSFHRASKFVVAHCLKHGISTIIIGHNDGWKQNLDIGKKNNQNFANIPFNKFIAQIAYKARLQGINVVMTEESYTSKASFLDLDPMPKYVDGDTTNHTFNGYRENRGMYKLRGRKVRINADVNGSYNIIRKVVTNAFAEGIGEFSVIPAKVTFGK